MPRGKQFDVLEKTEILAWFHEGIPPKVIAEAAAKRKGHAEGDHRQQGSAGAGHAAASQEAKRASQDRKFRTGEPASTVPDRPPV